MGDARPWTHLPCFLSNLPGHPLASGSLEPLSRDWAGEGEEAHALPALSQAHLLGLTVASTFGAHTHFSSWQIGPEQMELDGSLGQPPPLRKGPISVPPNLDSWPGPPPPVLRAALHVLQAQQTSGSNSSWGFPVTRAFRSLLAPHLLVSAWEVSRPLL